MMRFATVPLHTTTISLLKRYSCSSRSFSFITCNKITSELRYSNRIKCNLQPARTLSSSSPSSTPSPSPSPSSSMVPTSNPNPPTEIIPIDFDTSSSIQGEESQTLQIHLQPNQILRAESGAMLFMTQGVEMETSLSSSKNNTGSSGIISEGFARMMTGQNLFFSDYSYKGEAGTTGTVALGTDFPSKIIRFSLGEYGGKIVCQKGALLASSLDVDVRMEFTKRLTAGFFGGEGFVLQGLVGEGDVFCKAGGTVVKKELREGETIRISSGCLVAFTQDVEYDVQTMPGFKNVLFGGEGLFITTLTGPGTIWLQGMPPDRMISEIARRVPSGGGIGLGIPIGMGGGGAGAGDGDGGGVVDGGEGSEGTDGDVDGMDDAIASDRSNTVASSGIHPDGSGGGGVDADSPSALFGDAAGVDSSSSSSSSSSDGIPEMEESTSFSTDEDTSSFSTTDDEMSFGDDNVGLSDNDQFDAGGMSSSSFSEDAFPEDDPSTESFDSGGGIGGDDDGGDGEGGGIGGILGQLWDLFTDDE